ncbi:MAG: DNA-3-methyladenine glycosylase 2 family protein [Candidatus Rokuibacteriota bacterium]|nr:MAG: DNA-3-methyladenine glycosylase 2 family protein [Candidatus Rokubacteria bacterium]
MTADARRHLGRDPVMRRLIRRHGPYRRAPLSWSPYEALTRAIAHQQLNGRAAETILARFVGLFGNGRFPSPAAVAATSPARLRSAGFSRGKVRAIKDIARHAIAGTVPTRRAAARLSDEEIIERLTPIYGVGRWTVEMLLIFTLGRPDVLPVDDFGVREGYRVAYGRRVRPSPTALHAYGERWKPHRSTAAWYLWRAANDARKK